jgi:hypothetical protein
MACEAVPFAALPNSLRLWSISRCVRRVVTSPYPYLIFYHATGDELVIHGVRHTARKQSSMPGSMEQESP